MLKTSEVETLETAQQLLHFKDAFNYQTIKQLSAVLFSMHTKPVPIKLHIATASGISVTIIKCFVILSPFNPFVS